MLTMTEYEGSLVCILNRLTGKISNILFALFTPITLSTNLKHQTMTFPSLVELLDLIQVVSPLPCGQCCPLHGLSASSYHNPARNTTWCDPVRNIGHLPRRPVCKKQWCQPKYSRISWILEQKFPSPEFLIVILYNASYVVGTIKKLVWNCFNMKIKDVSQAWLLECREKLETWFWFCTGQVSGSVQSVVF